MIKTFTEKIGITSSSSLFNTITSGTGAVGTGSNCLVCIFKELVTTNLWYKTLYFRSATLNHFACVFSTSCLISGYSCIAPILRAAASLGFAPKSGARACNSLGRYLEA
jgi:hypothetical protein